MLLNKDHKIKPKHQNESFDESHQFFFSFRCQCKEEKNSAQFFKRLWPFYEIQWHNKKNVTSQWHCEKAMWVIILFENFSRDFVHTFIWFKSIFYAYENDLRNSRLFRRICNEKCDWKWTILMGYFNEINLHGWTFHTEHPKNGNLIPAKIRRTTSSLMRIHLTD